MSGHIIVYKTLDVVDKNLQLNAIFLQIIHPYIRSEIPVLSLALMPYKDTKKKKTNKQKTKTKPPKNNQTKKL